MSDDVIICAALFFFYLILVWTESSFFDKINLIRRWFNPNIHTASFLLPPHPHPHPSSIIYLSHIQMLHSALYLVLGPSMWARCLFMDCTNDRMTRGEGSKWLMKWGRIIKQNSLHLEKLVLCGSPLLCSFTLARKIRGQLHLKPACVF